MREDHTAELQAQVNDAIAANQQLRISAGGSKRFLFNAGAGVPLNVALHKGVVYYDPTEMVITARAGTSLAEVESALRKHGQMLSSENPAFDGQATLGGTVAAGLCGPRSPFAGSLRDIVLGCKMINGKGEALSFGGQVLKNVAGYDISRLMVGSCGILGIILEVSIKVIPRPESEITLALKKESLRNALELSNELIRQAVPVSAVCYHDGKLVIRISGNQRTVSTLREQVGGEVIDNHFWSRLGNLKLPFFTADSEPLWRLIVPATSPALALQGQWLIDWNGAQRWYRGTEPADHIRNLCQAVGGYATCFRSGAEVEETFHPLESGLMRWHQQLKQAFDPQRLFNADLMYSGL